MISYTISELKAALMYIKRQARKVHPEGKFDKAGRWYPSGRDEAVFAYDVRSPSRAWPYSYMLACRTMKHCAKLYGADLKAVRRAVKAIQAS